MTEFWAGWQFMGHQPLMENTGTEVCVHKGSTELDLGGVVGFVASVEYLTGTGRGAVGHAHWEARRRAWIWKCAVVVVQGDGVWELSREFREPLWY